MSHRYLYRLLLISTMFAGCSGWHLRGTVDGEGGSYTAYINYSRADKVGGAMYTAIRSRGIKWAPKSEADFSISILNERFKRRVVSIDPTSGYVRELELLLNCEIVVRDKNGSLVVPRQTLRLRQDYYFDELSAEFTTNRREALERDLAADAATSIVLRLNPGKSKESQ